MGADELASDLDAAYELLDAGRPADALPLVERYLAAQPDSAEAHNLRGLLLDELDRPDEAAAAYRQALALDPTFEDACQNLAELESERPEPAGGPRPLWVWLAAIWSLLRGFNYLWSLILRARLLLSFYPSHGLFDLPRIWPDMARVDPLTAIPLPLLFLLFGGLALGLARGQRWARRGFLWLSLAVLLWNLRVLGDGRLMVYSLWLPLQSALALGLASWLLRRPALLAYFGERRVEASWRRLDWRNVPLDLLLSALAVLLLALQRALNLSGMLDRLLF